MACYLSGEQNINGFVKSLKHFFSPILIDRDGSGSNAFTKGSLEGQAFNVDIFLIT
jgi:hypothetical protein